MTVRLLFLVIVGLIANVYCQVIGNGIGFNGLAANGLATNGMTINGLAANGLATNGLATNGLAANNLFNGFGTNCGPNLVPNLVNPGFAGYPGGVPVGYGDVAVAGELPVCGTTAVAGQVPVIGYVNFEGYLPAGGLVSVAPTNCGCI